MLLLRLGLFVALFSSSVAAGNPIRGVNLGGWLVMEPWITPELFDLANNGVPKATDGSMQIVDEWTWHNSSLKGAQNRTQLLLNHWKTWVSQEDIQRLYNAGITHLRIPVGYWYWNHTADEVCSGPSGLGLVSV